MLRRSSDPSLRKIEELLEKLLEHFTGNKIQKSNELVREIKECLDDLKPKGLCGGDFL